MLTNIGNNLRKREVINVFKNLRSAMDESNITTTHLAAILGIAEKSVRNKLNGITDWTWPEAKNLTTLFPKYNMEWLFHEDNESSRDRI